MKKILPGLLLFALLLVSGYAAPLERDLGRGLTYCRVAALPDDLPSARLPGSCVLDLRYTTGDGTAAATLRTWLDINARANAPIFILLNADTHPAVLRQLAPPMPWPGVLTLGANFPGYVPDIVISVSPADEARTYAALPTVTDLPALLTAAPTKTRVDEAAILAAKASGSLPPDEPQLELNDSEATETETGPLVDLALQRAVQIHRAWIILRSHRQG